MMTIDNQTLQIILAATVVLLTGGFVGLKIIKKKNKKYSVKQKNIHSRGDVVGRDKITNEKK